MEMYYEIGRLVSDRQKKSVAVAAAEYLQSRFPEAFGFSPRSLRRMREFYCAYGNAPEVMNEAMSLGWTQNTVILEADLTMRERLWYIRAALRFGWSKSILVQQITYAAHWSLDLVEEMCYTEENDFTGEVPGHAKASDSQCDGAGSKGTAVGLPTVFSCSIPNFSIEDFTPSCHWFVEGVDGPWEWRMELARRDVVAYDKLFSRRASLVSQEWYPDLANYRRDGYDFNAHTKKASPATGRNV